MKPIFREFLTPASFSIPKEFAKGMARFEKSQVEWSETPITYPRSEGDPTLYNWESIRPPYSDADMRKLAYLSRCEWSHTSETRSVARSIFNRVAEKIESPQDYVWENILYPWVRKINEIIFCYLDSRLRPQMEKLTEALDKKLERGDWTNWVMTGSNIHGSHVGKACWALVRDNRDKYTKHIQSLRSWLPLAYPRGSGDKVYRVPSEGPMYGMFGAKAFPTLTFLQQKKNISPDLLLLAKELPNYYNISLVERSRLHTHGDSREYVNWGSEVFLGLWMCLGDRGAAKFVANMWDDPPIRYWEALLGVNAPPLQPSQIREGVEWCFSKEKNHLVYRNDKYTTVLDGGTPFGKNRLHYGLKPSSYSYWNDGWVEKDGGYVNPTRDWRTYDPSVFNTIEDTKLPDILPIEQVNYNAYRIGSHKLICGMKRAEVLSV